MPAPKKRKKESCQEYVSRLISFYRNEGRGQSQAVAIAYSQARKAGCKFSEKRSK